LAHLRTIPLLEKPDFLQIKKLGFSDLAYDPTSGPLGMENAITFVVASPYM
jgi:hypothetical protein